MSGNSTASGAADVQPRLNRKSDCGEPDIVSPQLCRVHVKCLVLFISTPFSTFSVDPFVACF